MLRVQLTEALVKHPGLGISVTQIGIKKRVCLIQFGDEELFLVNPVIKEKSKEGFLFFEGCLSIPSTLTKPIKTIRACKVVVDTDNLGELTFEINPDGDKQNESISKETMMTVIVQHEIDHLDGFTIKDRVYNTQIVKTQTYGRKDKIVMKSKEGEMVEIKFKNANKYFLQGYEIV
jgi:peptide deformylase